MENQLLQGYYWLSSAIAQAFAALIALTAMFYIYRKQALKNQINEILNHIRGFAWVAFCDKEHDEQIRKGITAKDFSLEYLKFYQLCPPQKILEFAEQDLDVLTGQIKEDCQKATSQYRDLVEFDENFKRIVITPIVLSALAMAAGIAALLFGNKLCLNQKWIIMIVESLLAAVALGWTAYVVIRMLKEPQD